MHYFREILVKFYEDINENIKKFVLHLQIYIGDLWIQLWIYSWVVLRDVL